MSEQLPKWCQILAEWLANAEQELNDEKEKGPAPPAPNKDTAPPHPAEE